MLQNEKNVSTFKEREDKSKIPLTLWKKLYENKLNDMLPGSKSIVKEAFNISSKSFLFPIQTQTM
ncbi:CLUMA_CG007272, isoform A [Clunio marinus]|uniref:CLUMA_CG007272, isoform A n=1 Tax=Clunio marinus TaxID=568069 RepID=A0A1J1I073_9DIPT|nr:CLUMA_CG007272, isoform A [Clunio marinus]